MAVWGEVSYKVKKAIALRERFTVAELADATDLVYTQVEQAVQRLISQGYARPLEAHELKEAEQAAARRVGRPRKRYTLTEEPSKRGEFYASVEAIAAAERMSRARERKPSTPHFSRAMKVIEAMERGAEAVSTACLDEAAGLLAYGRDFEGLIPEGAEITQAHYDRALARLETLQGNYPRAEELLAQAEDAFRAAGLDEEVQRSIDLRLARQVTQGLMAIKPIIEHRADLGDLGPALERLERLVCDFPSRSYLLLPLRQVIEAMVAVLGLAVREMQIAIWANTRAVQQNTEAVRQMAQAMERGRSEFEIGKELIPEGMRAMEPSQRERFEPQRMDRGIHIRREEIFISPEVLRQVTWRER